MENKLNIMIVNFNTPYFIEPLIKSFYKFNKWFDGEIHIVDNSNNDNKLKNINFKNVKIIYFDNNNYKCLDILPDPIYEPKTKGSSIRYGSAHHSLTIDWYIKNIANSDYLLLLDSDILFKDNCKYFYDQLVKENYALIGYKRTRYEKFTIAPWCCFINLKLLKEYNFNYFDINRIIYVNNNLTYDTGASLYEDFTKVHEKIKEIPNNFFTIHLKGGSVIKNKYKLFLEKYKSLYS